jgi:basic amino acid/polyamine antiporter, APA family
MTSIGTLLAFVIVCAGVMIMRRTHPESSAALQDAAGAAGADSGHLALVCFAMMASLDKMLCCGETSKCRRQRQCDYQ